MIKLIKSKIQNLLSDKKFSEILTGSAWALSARVITTGLGMVTSIIIARVYGAEVMGIEGCYQLLSHAGYHLYGTEVEHFHPAAYPGTPGQVFSFFGFQALT
jgi:hypothetical protein